MKKNSLFHRILQSNHILFIFAVIISLIIWIYMSFISSNNDTTIIVGEIPIQIELSEEARDLGLQVFLTGEPKASVTVSGNRTILGLVNENDFTVTAAASSINSTGNYTLPVSAVKRSTAGNFQITNAAPSTISVTVDYFKESEFQIQDGIIYYVEDGYFGSASLSYNTITISGPQSEILKIKKVMARANISNALKQTQDVDANIVLLDENNNELSSKLLNLSFDTVKATVTVLPEKNVAIKPVFINKPEGLQITEDMIRIEPSEILLAGPEDVLSKIQEVALEPIDFSTLKNEKIDFDDLSINIPENCRSIGNYTTARVSLDLSGLSTKTLTVDKFLVEGLSDGYESEMTSKSIRVNVIGAKEEIEKLTAAQVTAVIDTSDYSGKIGSVEMPVGFRFNKAVTCWAYGTYQANVIISSKQ